MKIRRTILALLLYSGFLFFSVYVALENDIWDRLQKWRTADQSSGRSNLLI